MARALPGAPFPEQPFGGFLNCSPNLFVDATLVWLGEEGIIHVCFFKCSTRIWKTSKATRHVTSLKMILPMRRMVDALNERYEKG